MPSTISAARSNLFALLVAAAGLDGVQTIWGLPPHVEGEEQEVVALLGVESPDEDWASIGATRRDETYEIVVAVKTYGPAGTAAEVDTRCFAIVDAVRDTVLDNKTLSSTPGVLYAHPVSTSSAGAQPAADGGFICFAQVNIAVRARIDS